MASSRRAVLDLLAAVADGKPVPWDGIQTGDPVADGKSVRVLRTIAGVAEVHRTAGAESEQAWEPARPTRPEAGRWGPFTLLERLGQGAFADVYRAHDPDLDRDVALKLFRTDRVAGSERRTRLLREARTLARVRHEHVVQVYGADEHDGRVGAWMELIHGRNLEEELGERGRLSAKEAAAIGQEVCRALAAVHGAGFIHGDIKAHNVMREEGGRVVLMDFGAGRSRRGVEDGAISGTPLYLAPEVLTGHSPSVNTDVYSLGVLLYHLVTTTYPVSAASFEELRWAHAGGTRTRLADVRPDLDPAFVRVVERGIANNPADRFQSAGEMEAALAQVLGAIPSPPAPVRRRRWPAVAAGTLAAALIVAMTAGPALIRRINAPDIDSVAVLPFRSIGSQDDLAYLSEGVSSDLTRLLARSRELRVVGGISVQQFRGTSKPAAEVGQALRVRTIVAGVVQLSGDRVSVNVEVVDCQTSRQIWSQRFDRRMQDLLATQTEIARSIVAALRGRLSERTARAMEQRPIQPDAYNLYLLGRHHWNKRTAEGLRRSIGYFEEAARVDPSSGLPQAALADAYVLSAAYGIVPGLEAHERAETAALRATQLDPDLAEAYAALGSIRALQFRWRESEAALRRAIELQPSYASAHHWYALYLVSHGDFDRAQDHMQQALDEEPLSVAMGAALAFVHYMSRDYTAAIAQYQRALEVENGPGWVHINLAISYIGAGQPENALAQLEKARAAGESETNLKPLRASVYALAGRTAEARQLLASSADAAPGLSTEHAAAWVALHEDDAAFEWLERAVTLREEDVQYLAVEPRFDRVRPDPRFGALLARIGLQK